MTAARRALLRMPLFEGMNPKELTTLESILQRRTLQAGESLFAEGARPLGCYVLLSGEINVLKAMHNGKSEHLATLKAGALVGHVALIDNRPRSATCTAVGPAILLRLANADFDRLFTAHSPFAFKILDRIALDLVARLRTATLRLTDAATTTSPNRRRVSVREAAEALLSGSGNAVDDMDLDSITFSVPEFSRKTDHRPR